MAGNGDTDELVGRVKVDRRVCGGKPTGRGFRIKVETILSLLRQGATYEEILGGYRDLEADDIGAGLAYAADHPECAQA
ncbi:MAG: DUF433 domain-containing protein [Bacillota bacterium]